MLNNDDFRYLYHLSCNDNSITGIGLYNDEKVYFTLKEGRHSDERIEFTEYFKKNNPTILDDDDQLKEFIIGPIKLSFEIAVINDNCVNDNDFLIHYNYDNEEINQIIKNKTFDSVYTLYDFISILAEKKKVYILPFFQKLYEIYRIPEKKIIEIENDKIVDLWSLEYIGLIQENPDTFS